MDFKRNDSLGAKTKTLIPESRDVSRVETKTQVSRTKSLGPGSQHHKTTLV